MWESLETLIKAAEQGDVPAQFNLSECFARGEGVEIDSEKAAEWYKKA